jgi:hypothetical protein
MTDGLWRSWTSLTVRTSIPALQASSQTTTASLADILFPINDGLAVHNHRHVVVEGTLRPSNVAPDETLHPLVGGLFTILVTLATETGDTDAGVSVGFYGSGLGSDLKGMEVSEPDIGFVGLNRRVRVVLAPGDVVAVDELQLTQLADSALFDDLPCVQAEECFGIYDPIQTGGFVHQLL